MLTYSNELRGAATHQDGLSTDQKPMNAINGSTIYEMDTQKVFKFDAENKIWIEQ